LIKDLLKRDNVRVVRGSTFDNAKNLAPSALAELRLRYENTRLGRQELYGEVLEEVEGALWTRDIIESARVTKCPPLVRIVVGVDPAVTSGESSDETGIVVAGITADGHYYVLDDKTLRATPDAWARVAVNTYHEHKADRIVAETNNGGDMVTLLMRQVDSTVSVKKVTATRGKQLRAEPISSLYEQGRVHHVGYFAELEMQMCEWTPQSNESPDRLDALVWAITELNTGGSTMLALASMALLCSNCGMPSPKTASVCGKCGNNLRG
jgi:predicted phage terminase large subunit-like protein